MNQNLFQQTQMRSLNILSIGPGRGVYCRYHHCRSSSLKKIIKQVALVLLVLVTKPVESIDQQQNYQLNTTVIKPISTVPRSVGPVPRLETTTSDCCNKSCEYPIKRLLLQEVGPLAEPAEPGDQDQDDMTITRASTNLTNRFKVPEVSEQIIEPIENPSVVESGKLEAGVADNEEEGAGEDNAATNERPLGNLTRAQRDEAKRKQKKFIQDRLEHRQRKQQRRKRISKPSAGPQQGDITFATLPAWTSNRPNSAQKINQSTGNLTRGDKWEPINDGVSRHSSPVSQSWRPSALAVKAAASGESPRVRSNNLAGPILPYSLPKSSGAKLIRLSDFLPLSTGLGPKKLSFFAPRDPARTEDLLTSAHSQDVSLTPSVSSIQDAADLFQYPPKLVAQHQHQHQQLTAARLLSALNQRSQPSGRPDLQVALENYQHNSINSQLPSAMEYNRESGDFGDIAGLPVTYVPVPFGNQRPSQPANTEGSASDATIAAEQLLQGAMKQLSGDQSLQSIQSLIDANLAQTLEGAIKGISNNLEASKSKASSSSGLDQPVQSQQDQQQLAQVSQNKQLSDLINLFSANQQQQQQQQQPQPQPQPQPQQQQATSQHQLAPPMPMAAQNALTELITANNRPIPAANPYNGSPETASPGALRSYARPPNGQPKLSPLALGFAPTVQPQIVHQYLGDYGHSNEESRYEPLEIYGPQKKKSKARRSKSSPRSPQIKMQKRPRTARAPQQKMHEIDSAQDLNPSATFHKYKYPWYRPDDDDEEEGETELNIRFFNNFSRMGPLGGLARVGGTATVIMSLAFLILSNFSLAATVIAHGIAGILRNLGQSPDRNKLTTRQGRQHVDERQNGNWSTTAGPKTDTNHKQPSRLDDKIRAFNRKWT